MSSCSTSIVAGPRCGSPISCWRWTPPPASPTLSRTDAFTHLRTGAPGKDRIGLLNVLLAEGINAEGLNLGLSKMAEASNTHDFCQLSRLARWHIESEAINRALAMVIEAPAQLPMTRLWGQGLTASSDGQFFPAPRQGEAMNLVRVNRSERPLWQRTGPQGLYPCLGPVRTLRNANNPGHGQRSALYSRRVADDPGWAAHPRAIRRLRRFHRPGLRRHIPARLSVHPAHPVIPRIRDLPSKRRHVFEPRRVPKPLIGLTGNKIREDVIVRNWPDIRRVAATLASGALRPSQLLRK